MPANCRASSESLVNLGLALPRSAQRALAMLNAACQRASLLRFSAWTNASPSFPLHSQLNSSQMTTTTDTMTAGTKNNCKMKPALGGSTGGKESLGETPGDECELDDMAGTRGTNRQ